MTVDKLYVTNNAAIEAKYGSEADQILTAISDLVTADAARGLSSEVVDLSSVPGTDLDPTDAAATKSAIDAQWNATSPGYLVIVGGLDIVCMQDLANPVYEPDDPDGDQDPDVPSDLPYACDAGYSTEIETFRGPTRVVGRLPDETGDANVASFLSVLDTGQQRTAIGPVDDGSLFAVSALRWQPAAEAVLGSLGVDVSSLQTSPAAGPTWTNGELDRTWHWISCHGSSATPFFVGEDLNGNYPHAVEAGGVPTPLTEGTVTATGCCYGAELYPAAALGEARGVAMTYLLQGASTYVGSTTIAYGSDDEPSGCDTFCGLVLQSLTGGRSAGAALLQARQTFVDGRSALSPTDLKTLAQFVLYGDPEHTPSPSDAVPADASARTTRRERSQAIGADLGETMPVAVRDAGATPRSRGGGGTTPAIAAPREVGTLLQQLGFADHPVARFGVRGAPRRRANIARGAAAEPGISAFYVSSRTVADIPDARTPLIELVEVAERTDGTLEHTIFTSR